MQGRSASGDSPTQPSSPNPDATSADNMPQSARGRGRPTSDSIRIPWQVLELSNSPTATAAARGCDGGSAPAAEARGSVDDQVKNMPEEGSSKLVINHKRKHYQTTRPLSVTNSPGQQEAPHDDSPASGGDDIIAVKKNSSDGVAAAQEKAKMESLAAAFAVITGKEKIEVKPSGADKGKKIEEPCAEADENLDSSEAFAEEKNEDDDESSDDDAVTSKINKEMFLPCYESFEVGNNDEENKEIMDENFADDEEEKTADTKGEKGEEAFDETAAKEKEASGFVSGEKKHEVAESSNAAQKRTKMTFTFDLNELPSAGDDDEGGVMP